METISKFFKNPSFYHAFLTFLVSALTTLGICITGYTHYIEKNIINDRIVIQNSEKIKELNSKNQHLEDKIHLLQLEKEKLESDNHTFEIKLSNINHEIVNLKEFQIYIQKDVKENVKNKVSMDEFWKILGNVDKRLRWLENHY